MVTIRVVHNDLLTYPCDLMILKHANGFHGVDKLIAERLRFSGELEKGQFAIVPGHNIEARQVLFLGVGPLYDFKYEQIREFGRQVIKLAMTRANSARRICSPVHGPGYGLDENEAFLSLIGGFSDAVNTERIDDLLEELVIVERDERRAEYFSGLLMEMLIGKSNGKEAKVSSGAVQPNVRPLNSASVQNLSRYGRASALKTRLFVAMPFAKTYSDEWEIAITEAARSADILCESIDEQSYTGDVLNQIKKRISEYDGVVALLNDCNPNVFLELGFAWAMEKPTILIAKESGNLPFDVRGQRCIMYSSIADLRKKLAAELSNLKVAGLFAGSHNHNL